MLMEGCVRRRGRSRGTAAVAPLASPAPTAKRWLITDVYQVGIAVIKAFYYLFIL